MKRIAANLLSFIVLGMPLSVRAGTYTTLHQFNNHPDGELPAGGVIEDASGTLYGETAGGGSGSCTTKHGLPQDGCGTVYSFTANGTFKVLASFHGPNGAYGESGLSLVGSILVGATSNGGADDVGVVFALKTDGSGFTVVHQFSGTDGAQPIGPLVQGKGGVFYGITSSGGADHLGVLFSLTSAGVYKVLHSFSGTEGAHPLTLLARPGGTLVGSTFDGGPPNATYCPSGCGVVFSFNPAGGQYAVLQTFTGETAANPYLGSVGQDGTVYGNNENLFSISPANVYTILGQANSGIGFAPYSGPTLAPDGSIYGTYTQNNYNVDNGTIYSYVAGVYKLAYLFGDGGAFPASQPIINPAGALIGTTNYGGPCANCGTIYQFTP